MEFLFQSPPLQQGCGKGYYHVAKGNAPSYHQKPILLTDSIRRGLGLVKSVIHITTGAIVLSLGVSQGEITETVTFYIIFISTKCCKMHLTSSWSDLHFTQIAKENVSWIEN